MFSQLTQLASKFSLDTLQEGEAGGASKTAAAETAPAAPPSSSQSPSPGGEEPKNEESKKISRDGNKDADHSESHSSNRQGHSLSAPVVHSEKPAESIFGNLGLSTMLHATSLSLSASSASSSHHPSAVSTADSELASLKTKLESHERDIKGLHSELTVVTEALDAATKELSEVREELNVEKAMHKDTQARYQDALVLARAHPAAKAATNSCGDTLQLQESLSAEKSKSESLLSQLTALKEKYDSLSNQSDKKLGAECNVDQELIQENSSLKSKAKELQGELDALQQRMHESTVLLHSQLDAANAASSKATERVLILEAEISKVQGLLAQRNDELAVMTVNTSASNSKVAELVAQLAVLNEKSENDVKAFGLEKDERIAELTSKLASLTEKAKDYIKKYSDAKQQIANLENSNAKLTSDLVSLGQAKESELTSLRLKFEAQAASATSSKTASEELSERCDELTRELQRCRLALQDSKNTVEVLERDAKEHDVTLKHAQDTVAQLEENFKNMTDKHREELKSMERKLLPEIEDLKGELFNAQAALADAKRDIEALQSERESSEAAAKNLDEYKKKAQAALKKSAESVSALTAEVAELKKATEDLGAERAALLTKYNDAVINIEKEQSLADELRSANESLLSAQSAARQRIEELESTAKDLEVRLAESSAKTEEALAALAVVKSSVSATGTNLSEKPLPSGSKSTEQSNMVKSPERDTSAKTITSPETAFSPQFSGEVDRSPRIPVRATRQRAQQQQQQQQTLAQQRPADGAEGVEKGHLHDAEGTESIDNALDDSIDFPEGVGSSLFYTNELLRQVEDLRTSLAASTAQCDSLRSQLETETRAKLSASDKLEECLAFLERTKKLQSGPESAINMEYLKNCVLHYMLSTGVSERLRLYPVIGMILKFTSAEMARLASSPLHVDSIASSIELADSAWTNITGFASSSLSGWFAGGSGAQTT